MTRRPSPYTRNPDWCPPGGIVRIVPRIYDYTRDPDWQQAADDAGDEHADNPFIYDDLDGA